MLKARSAEQASVPPANSKTENRKVIGFSTRGPVYEEDFDARYKARRIQSALTDIADD